MTTAEEFRDAQAAEYGEWVANKPITINGVRAFNPGDPVPRGHVTGHVVRKDDVSKARTKATRATKATKKAAATKAAAAKKAAATEAAVTQPQES